MPKILKFSASWCMPCKALSANIATLTPDERALFEEHDVDTEESKVLVTQYGLRSVPTMVLLNDKGSVIKMVSGMQSPSKLRELIALL